MSKIQKQKSFGTFNLCTGRSINVNFLFKIIKKNIKPNSKIIRKKLDKFDPKKSSGSSKKILQFLKIKKYNFTKLESGLNSTIDYIRSVKN